jgi:hypothetical protein
VFGCCDHSNMPNGKSVAKSKHSLDVEFLKELQRCIKLTRAAMEASGKLLETFPGKKIAPPQRSTVRQWFGRRRKDSLE